MISERIIEDPKASSDVDAIISRAFDLTLAASRLLSCPFCLERTQYDSKDQEGCS